jgi:hypothetical protein
MVIINKKMILNKIKILFLVEVPEVKNLLLKNLLNLIKNQ